MTTLNTNEMTREELHKEIMKKCFEIDKIYRRIVLKEQPKEKATLYQRIRIWL